MMQPILQNRILEDEEPILWYKIMNFHALASTGKKQILNKTSDVQLGFVVFSLSGLAYLGFRRGLAWSTAGLGARRLAS